MSQITGEIRLHIAEWLLFLYSTERGYRLEETNGTVEQMLEGRVAQIDAIFTGLLDQAYYFCMLPEVENLDPEVLPGFLKEVRTNEIITEIAIITKDEYLFLPDLHIFNDNLSNWEFYQEILVKKKSYYISAFLTSEGNTVISISVPVRDRESGQSKAVLNISLDIFDFAGLVSDEISIYGGSGYIFSKPDATMITNKNHDLILSLDMAESSGAKDGYDDLLKASSESAKGHIPLVDQEGVASETFFSEISVHPEWVLAINVPSEEISNPVRRLLYTVLSGIIVVLLVLIGVIWFILNKVVTKPVKSMTDMLKDIAAGGGDLTQRINLRIKRGKEDEISEMAGYFNTFIGSLNEMIVDLKGVGEVNREFGDSLAANTEEISASSTESAATTRSIGEQMTLLSGRIEKSTEKITRIQEQIERVNANVDNEASFIEESSSAITQMISSIKNLSRISSEKKLIIDDLAKHAEHSGMAMGKTAEDISEISGSVDTIISLVDIINSVSDQINILSMNAAIEAAHAGDAGRGFSVVAEEIRKLAEATNEQSKRINESVTVIARKIAESGENSKVSQESVLLINRNISSISDTINELVMGMAEIAEGSNQITESLNELVSSSQSVRESASIVDENTKEMLEDIEEINMISARSNEGVREIVEGSVQINVAIEDLASMGEKNNENILLMNDKLDQFTVDETENGKETTP